VWTAVLVEKDVPGFYVSVQDPVLMSVVDYTSQRGQKFRCPARPEVFFSQHLIEPTPFDELHAKIAMAITLPDLINRNDPGVIQASRRFSLDSETF
jgi:hypothetical protein